LFPLVRQLFGASILGSSKPRVTAGTGSEGRTGERNHMATFGSYTATGKGKKSKKSSLTQFAEMEGDHTKYIILEERSYHQSTSELRADDEVMLEQARATKPAGW
jgi:hypothetical protein